MAHWMDDPKWCHKKAKCTRAFLAKLDDNLIRGSKTIRSKQNKSLIVRQKKVAVTLPKLSFMESKDDDQGNR
jgi:hypothetical protein